MEDLKGGVPIGRTQFRGVLAVLQWWGFNVLVIIMNKWIFQVSAHIKFMIFLPMGWKTLKFEAECCGYVSKMSLIWVLFTTFMLYYSDSRG